jgi:hypothetical protein
MPVYSISCPECRTTLKSSKPIPAGKVLDCPKCGVMFAAPAPKPKREEVEVIEDVEVIDDVDVIEDVEVVDDDTPAKPAARRTPARPGAKPAGRKPTVGVEAVDDDEDERPRSKFKSKRKSGSNNGLLIGLVAAGLVLVLGGGGALAWWLLSGAGDEPLAYLAADSNIIVGIDGQALLNSQLGPKIEELLNSPALGPLGKYKADVQAQNRDLFQQIVIGVKPEGNDAKGTIILKGDTSWNAEKLAKAFGNPTTKSVGGYSAYQVPVGGGPKAIVVPNKKVALISDLPDDRLSKVLKAGGKTSALTGDTATLVAKAAGNHVWLAIGLDDTMRSQMMAGLNASLAATPAAKPFATAMQQSKGFGLWGKLEGQQVQFSFAMLMSDPAAAQQLTTTMQAESQKAANDLATKAMLALMPAPVKALWDEVQNSAQYTTDGTMAVVSVKVYVVSIEAAINSLGNVASMFGGMAGAPGAPPPGMGQTPPGAARPMQPDSPDTPPPGRAGGRGAGKGGGGKGGRGGKGGKGGGEL